MGNRSLADKRYVAFVGESSDSDAAVKIVGAVGIGLAVGPDRIRMDERMKGKVVDTYRESVVPVFFREIFGHRSGRLYRIAKDWSAAHGGDSPRIVKVDVSGYASDAVDVFSKLVARMCPGYEGFVF